MTIEELIGKKRKKINFKLSKLLITIIVFLLCLIGLKSNENFKKNFYKYVFEQNLSFTTISKTYEKYFGKPIPFDDLVETKPVFSEKLQYNSSQPYLDGVELSVSDEYLIPSQLGGLVVFIGEKEGYGKTVVIQQYNGIDLWYGGLSDITVELYDYIEEGSLIGTANNKLYLVYKKNGKVVDYNEYI